MQTFANQCVDGGKKKKKAALPASSHLKIASEKNYVIEKAEAKEEEEEEESVLQHTPTHQDTKERKMSVHVKWQLGAASEYRKEKKVKKRRGESQSTLEHHLTDTT